MKTLKNQTLWITAALMVLMAMTRFNHFGSSAVLPDASYAIFFLGGLYLGRTRAAFALLVLLLVEAAFIDYYAINYRDVSGWCVTSAYGFLAFAYASLWYVGHWFAPRHDLTAKGLLGLFATSAAATSLAFVIANVSFYLLAGYFPHMGIAEYTSRVAQYYDSYVGIALIYIGCAITAQMAYVMLIGKRRARSLTKTV